MSFNDTCVRNITSNLQIFDCVGQTLLGLRPSLCTFMIRITHYKSYSEYSVLFKHKIVIRNSWGLAIILLTQQKFSLVWSLFTNPTKISLTHPNNILLTPNNNYYLNSYISRNITNLILFSITNLKNIIFTLILPSSKHACSFYINDASNLLVLTMFGIYLSLPSP
jgi:hypothetical protein